ncbi:hypothetical protein SMG44B_50222 [Stenotrophomonas maltophilia]
MRHFASIKERDCAPHVGPLAPGGHPAPHQSPTTTLCYHRRFCSSRPPPARDGAKTT